MNAANQVVPCRDTQQRAHVLEAAAPTIWTIAMEASLPAMVTEPTRMAIGGQVSRQPVIPIAVLTLMRRSAVTEELQRVMHP